MFADRVRCLRQLAHTLRERHGVDAHVGDGSTKAADFEELKQRFCAREFPVLCLSRIGHEGHNLQTASVLVPPRPAVAAERAGAARRARRPPRRRARRGADLHPLHQGRRHRARRLRALPARRRAPPDPRLLRRRRRQPSRRSPPNSAPSPARSPTPRTRPATPAPPPGCASPPPSSAPDGPRLSRSAAPPTPSPAAGSPRLITNPGTPMTDHPMILLSAVRAAVVTAVVAVIATRVQLLPDVIDLSLIPTAAGLGSLLVVGYGALRRFGAGAHRTAGPAGQAGRWCGHRRRRADRVVRRCTLTTPMFRALAPSLALATAVMAVAGLAYGLGEPGLDHVRGDRAGSAERTARP